MPESGRVVTRTIVCVMLFALILGAYWPVLGYGFVSYDDEQYVTQNPRVQEGLTGSSIGWAWTAFHAANWHPLTWMSHMLDWELFGNDAGGHHAMSLLIHAVNAMLLFLLLDRLTGQTSRAALVALLFGLHPLHVESVAWIAERKDVLSTLLWLLVLAAYARYARSPTPRRYLLVALLLVLGLCAKPMLVTAPLTLLLLDFWPLRRFARGVGAGKTALRLMMEKVPLLLLSAASCVVTVMAQHAGRAVATLEAFPFRIRVENAAVAYAGYLWKALWPAGLAIPYPYPRDGLATWKILLALFVLGAVTVVAVRMRSVRPAVLAGWSWYLVTLIPVIGIVQVGNQAMADRYTYVPLIGVFVMLAWAIPGSDPARTGEVAGAAATWGPGRSAWSWAPALVLVPLLFAATRSQVRHWQDPATLARRALAVTQNNAIAHNLLGLELARRGDPADAVEQYMQAIEISPEYAEAYNNLGGAYAALGRTDQAIERYRIALRIEPSYPEALNNLGVALAGQGRVGEAVERFVEAVRLRPDYGKAHGNLAAAYYSLGRHDDAWREVELARASDFDPPAALVERIRKATGRD